MHFSKNKSLKNFNTFGIEAKASYYYSLESEEDVFSLLQSDEFQTNDKFVLGGGSNLLFTKDFEGLIIDNNIKGIKFIKADAESIILESGAGESWHDLVELCVKNRAYGIENLALIPGKVGSAPVQNIGAYGVEQKDFFHSLKGIMLSTGEKIELSRDDCRFGYRDSIFKNELKNDFIVTSVQYKLNRRWEANRKYAELDKALSSFSFIEQDAEYVFNTICRIRLSKLPDYKILGNAGSFFKNPVISNSEYANIKANHSELIGFNTGKDQIKLSAAKLIDSCNWKGKRFGDAGVYEKHALILVNYGNAKGSEILKLSEDIISSVKDKYDIDLEREVIII